jgi:hypothetical protein
MGTVQILAVGWLPDNLVSAQFGVLEEDKYAAKIRAVQPQITDWYKDSKSLAYHLNEYKVPKAGAIRFPFPHLGYVAHVTFAPTRTIHPGVCQNQFWTIAFSSVLWPLSTELSLYEQEWDTIGHSKMVAANTM